MIVESCKKGRVYRVDLYDLIVGDPYEIPISFSSTSRDKITKQVLSYIKRELDAGFENTGDYGSPHIIPGANGNR